MPFQLQATTLLDALIAAINFAREANSENYNACCLKIYEDSTFWITQRCYSNTSFGGTYESKDYYCLTVPATAYPGQAWSFSLVEFCARYAIKVTDRERKDWNGNLSPAAWDKVNPAESN